MKTIRIRSGKERSLLRRHPWIFSGAVEKASGNVARCNLDGQVAYRSLELPTWMLERAACAPMRMDTRPRVDVAALEALATLL